MKYESLRKLYYKDPKLYQQEYDSRWNGRAAIHIDFDVSGKPAFFEENNEVILLAFHMRQEDSFDQQGSAADCAAAVQEEVPDR